MINIEINTGVREIKIIHNNHNRMTCFQPKINLNKTINKCNTKQ